MTRFTTRVLRGGAARGFSAAVLALLAAATPSVAQAPASGTIAAVVRGAATVFAREYFDIALGEKAAGELRRRLDDGRYAGAASNGDLAGLLTRDLQELTHDKHVAVQLRRGGGSGGGERRDIPTTAGFTRIELLDGQVGLLELAFFLRPAEHRDAMADAMKTLQPARALILDMRSNGGGSPDTVALLISYLLGAPGTPLFDIARRDGTRDTYATQEEELPFSNGKRPVYVLTSRRTFSGGEGLAFLLQEHKRAVVVGEPTAGAANPGRPYPIDETFEVAVSNGRLLTALGRRNWEGAGVTPDFMVPAGDALEAAQKLALRLLGR